MRNRILARKREGWQGKKLPPPHRHHERHMVFASRSARTSRGRASQPYPSHRLLAYHAPAVRATAAAPAASPARAM
jgi:hypothetical protein